MSQKVSVNGSCSLCVMEPDMVMLSLCFNDFSLNNWDDGGSASTEWFLLAWQPAVLNLRCRHVSAWPLLLSLLFPVCVLPMQRHMYARSTCLRLIALLVCKMPVQRLVCAKLKSNCFYG